jgi:hypothetical protein
MQLIATRRYALDGLTGKEYAATDTLFRLDDGQFMLTLTTNGHTQEPDEEKLIDSEYAFQWLGEAPEQVEYHSARYKGGRTLIVMEAAKIDAKTILIKRIADNPGASKEQLFGFLAVAMDSGNSNLSEIVVEVLDALGPKGFFDLRDLSKSR